MRLLLDECLPKDLAREFSGHSVKTVPQAGWASVKNGALLRLIANSGKFDVFVTVDKNMPRQNKTRQMSFAIIVLRAKSNRLIHLVPFVHVTVRHLATIQPGETITLFEPV